MEAEKLKEMVVQLLRAKLNLPTDEQYLLRNGHILQQAMTYYSKYGDFSVEYDPGDGADGFDLTHIGGNINPFLIAYPPNDWETKSQAPLSGEPKTDLQPDHTLILPVKQTIVIVNEQFANIFRNDPKALRSIDPKKFEGVIAELFREEGYEVIPTKDGPDGGKDLYVYKKDSLTEILFLVECKRYNPPYKVDVGIARKLFGVVQHERASGGIIVTTSYFTKPAKEFAASIPYQLFLRDFDYLTRWLKKTR